MLRAGHPSPVDADTIKRPTRGRMPVDTTGRPLVVNRILIIGNRVTKEQIVLRELTVKAGDVVSIRGYDRVGMMVTAEVAQGTALEEVLERMLADGGVDSLHVHNAKPGCFNCRVERA